jgi:hypothetical protein
MDDIFSAIARFFLPGVLLAVFGFGSIFLFTGKNSRVRNWILAKNDRVTLVGAALIFLLWVAIVIFNRIVGQ